MVPCPNCTKSNKRYRAKYVGEDGNDGVDHFFECKKCKTKYETWYSRGSGGYTLSWSGGEEYITPPAPIPRSASTPRSVTSSRLSPRDPSIAGEPRSDGTTFVFSLRLYLASSLVVLILDPINLQLAIDNIPSIFLFSICLLLGAFMENGCFILVALIMGTGLGIRIFEQLVVLNPSWLLGYLALGLILNFWVLIRPGSSSAAKTAGGLAFLCLLCWQVLAFKATSVSIYNGLARAVTITLPAGNTLELRSGEFRSVPLPSEGRVVARLGDGTVIEAVELSTRSALFSKSLLYNIKSRGKLHLESSRGVKLESEVVHLKLTLLGHRGISILAPETPPPSYRHWIRIVEVQ